MWKRKELKKAARHSIKLNYMACINLCLKKMFNAGENNNR